MIGVMELRGDLPNGREHRPDLLKIWQSSASQASDYDFKNSDWT